MNNYRLLRCRWSSVGAEVATEANQGSSLEDGLELSQSFLLDQDVVGLQTPRRVRPSRGSSHS